MHRTIKGIENRICLAVVWFSPPLFPLLASKGKHVIALWEWKGEPLWLYQLWWRLGQVPNKMTARKIWDLSLLYLLLYVMCFVCRRGGCEQYSTPVLGEGGTDKWGRKLECWPWLASWPSQLEDSGPVGLIFTMMGAGKGNPCCLTWKELVS
jgi:hypothetical protein